MVTTMIAQQSLAAEEVHNSIAQPGKYGRKNEILKRNMYFAQMSSGQNFALR